MPNISVFSHAEILSHLQACTYGIIGFWKEVTVFDKHPLTQGAKRLTIIQSPGTWEWTKFGVLKDVHMYPLLAGKEQPVTCEITNEGLIMDPIVPIIRDRKFILYNDDGVIKASTKWRKLCYINIQSVGKNKVEFTAPEMPPLVVNLAVLPDKNLIRMDGCGSAYNCIFQTLEYIDCDQETADWFSKYLNSEKRMVHLAVSKLKESDFIKHFRYVMYSITYANKIAYPNAWNEYRMTDILNFVDNIMISTRVPPSFSDLSEHWTPLTAQPNIVIAADPGKTFAQDEWELLKIGNAVIRHSDHIQTRIPKDISDITNRYLVIGFNCKVSINGFVAPGDEVYIMNRSKKEDETSDSP